MGQGPGASEVAGKNQWLHWLGLVIILMAAFMDYLDASIVAVAAPSIRDDLGASYSAVQWVVAAYALVLALVLITASRLGDRFGRRRTFVVGMVGFTGASVACGAAQSPEMLIASRALQGFMAGVMLPQVLTMIQVNFATEERRTAYAMYGAAAGLAYVAAPLIGGVLLEADLFGLGWRAVFLINVPVCIVALVGSLLLVPESKAHTRTAVDLPGVGIVTVGLFLLMFPLLQGRDLGWPPWVFVMLAASVAVLAFFVRYETTKETKGGSPLVDLNLFRQRSFGIGITLSLVLVFGVAAFLFIYSIALQIGYGFTPLHLALTLLPWPLAFIVGSGVAGSLAPMHGRRLIAAAALLLAASMLCQIATLRHVDGAIHSWQLIPAMVLGGFGAGLSFPALGAVAMGEVHERDAGGASGILNTTFQLAAATGVAVLGALFFGVLSSHADTSARAKVPQISAELRAARVPDAVAAETLDRFRDCFNQSMTAKDPTAVASECRQANSGRAALSEAATSARRGNFAHAFETTLAWTAGLFVVAVALSFAVPRQATHGLTEPLSEY